MTDNRDSSCKGGVEPCNAEYDAIAERITGYRTGTGLRPGIYGANRCQLCGTITTFSTLAGARMAHFGPERERACGACMKRCGRDAVAAVIETRTERRCEVCAASVERVPANRLGSYWVCARCRPDVGPCDLRFGPADGLNQLVRRRYMALAYPTVDELLEFEEAVLAIKAELDRVTAQPAPGDEPGDGSGPVSMIIIGSPSSGRLR